MVLVIFGCGLSIGCADGVDEVHFVVFEFCGR